MTCMPMLQSTHTQRKTEEVGHHWLYWKHIAGNVANVALAIAMSSIAYEGKNPLKVAVTLLLLSLRVPVLLWQWNQE